jgi:hypothetical protein
MASHGGLVTETDLVVPALRLAAERPDGFIATADLIPTLSDIFNPTGKDAEIAQGRSDTYFSQKVRNLVSHRGSSFIAHGYADYDEQRRGIVVTQKGGAYGRRAGIDDRTTIERC